MSSVDKRSRQPGRRRSFRRSSASRSAMAAMPTEQKRAPLASRRRSGVRADGAGRPWRSHSRNSAQALFTRREACAAAASRQRAQERLRGQRTSARPLAAVPAASVRSFQPRASDRQPHRPPLALSMPCERATTAAAVIVQRRMKNRSAPATETPETSDFGGASMTIGSDVRRRGSGTAAFATLRR